MLWLWLGVAAVAAVWLLSHLWKRRSRRRELERSAEDKLREEALDRALVDRPPDADPAPSIPFEVRYDQNKKGGQAPRGGGEVMLQLTERGELSTRKYMLHVTARVTLGSRTGENDIVVSGSRVAPRQCEIFRIGHDLFAKNLAPRTRVILNRGRRRLTVGAEAVQLRSGDELLIGHFVYEVTIL